MRNNYMGGPSSYFLWIFSGCRELNHKGISFRRDDFEDEERGERSFYRWRCEHYAVGAGWLLTEGAVH